MTDQDLIKKLQSLKAIEADQEWLVSVRQELLAMSEAEGLAVANAPSEKKNALIFNFNLPSLSLRAGVATAAFFLVAAASGTLVLATNSLPGDALYNIKLASERVQNVLPVSEVAQAQRQDLAAQRRVDELAQIAQNLSDSSNNAQKAVAPVVAQQVKSYNQALQQNAASISQSGQNTKTDGSGIAKAKDEASVIQQSAQTLAIVLHETDNSADMEKILRATVGNRLPNCKDQQMLGQIQKLLASGELADLISANELSVRCTQQQ